MTEWLGPDFDGVIAFDEAHLMKNAAGTKRGGGDWEITYRFAASPKGGMGVPARQSGLAAAIGFALARTLADVGLVVHLALRRSDGTLDKCRGGRIMVSYGET
jgi:hypothetical protein